jgi:ferrous iron transport protein A
VIECRIRDLAIGDAARVLGFASDQRDYRSKLLAMGLTRGTVIIVRNIAPMGDPIHISIRGFELSLRKDEADALILQRIGGYHHAHFGPGYGPGWHRRFGPRRLFGQNGLFGPDGFFGPRGPFGPDGPFSHHGPLGHHGPFGRRGKRRHPWWDYWRDQEDEDQ